MFRRVLAIPSATRVLSSIATKECATRGRDCACRLLRRFALPIAIVSFLLVVLPSASVGQAVTATVTVGYGPGYADVNSNTNRIYVPSCAAAGSTCSGNGVVTVIDGATNATTTIPAGGRPFAAAVNPVTNEIYVANDCGISGAIQCHDGSTGEITVIDGATGSAINVIVAGPISVLAINTVTNKVYALSCASSPCAGTGVDQVVILDGATNATKTLAVGSVPDAVAVNEQTNRIYVANSDGNTVTVIDGTDDSVSTTVVVPAPIAIAVNSNTNQIYVASQANSVYVIDGATNATTAVGVGPRPNGIAVNQVTNQIYVANTCTSYCPDSTTGGTVTVIDGTTNATTTVPVGMIAAGPIAVNATTNKIYLTQSTNLGAGLVYAFTEIDGETNAADTFATGNGGLVSPVINSGTNTIYVPGPCIYPTPCDVVTVVAGENTAAASMISPTPGSMLPGSSVTFNWTTGVAATQYLLDVGTTPGGSDVAAINAGSNTSATVSNIPTKGAKLYVTLSSLIGIAFQSHSYTYTEYSKPTTLTLSAAPNPVGHGDTAILTATLSPYTGSDGETVTFYDGGTNIGTGSLSSGVATLNVSTLVTGTNPLTAKYPGDGTLAPSTSNSVSEIVNPPLPTTLILTAAPNPGPHGRPISLTATLSPFTGTDGEAISFSSNGSVIGAGTLASGVAALSVSTLPLGTDALTAFYPGDPVYARSTSNTFSEVVQLLPTTLTVSANTNPSEHGQTITIVATLSPFSGSDGERISFFSNAKLIGGGELISGVAEMDTSTLIAGTDQLTATYAGDSYYYLGSTAAAFSQTVNPPPPTVTSLAILPPTLKAPNTATLTATVTSGGKPLPLGQVKFCDTAINSTCTGNALLGVSQLLSNGKATLIKRFGFGSHPLQAIFMGRANHASSASAIVPFTQAWKSGAAISSIAVQAGSSSGSYDLGVTLTGLMASATPAAPTGSVSFRDTTNGDAVIGTGTLVPSSSGPTLQFRNVFQPLVGMNPMSVAVADFNGDGIPDMAVANGDDTVSILLGAGNGSFTPFATVTLGGTSGNGPVSIVAADFNSDGNIDLATNNRYGGLCILLGNGDGSFQPPLTTTFPGGIQAITTADFHNDGKPDLALITQVGNGNTYMTVDMLMGNGNGTFITKTTAQNVTNTGVRYLNSIAAGDFNEDGVPDIVAAPAGSFTGGLNILLNSGYGTFQAPIATPKVGTGIEFVAVADVNNDGHLDLLVTDSVANSVFVLLGNGDGTFQAPVGFPTGSAPSSVVVADLNMDGNPDLIVTNQNAHGTVSILLGNGDGTFQSAQTIAVGASPVFSAATDLNGDDKPDLVVINSEGFAISPGRPSLLLNLWGFDATATVNNVSIPGTGTHNIDAYFPGDANYRQATSATIPLAATGP